MTPAHHAIAVRRNARESHFLGDQNEIRVLRRVPQHGRERHRFIVGQYRDHPICVLKEQRDFFLLGRRRYGYRCVGGG